MAAVSRLGYAGYGIRRAGPSFVRIPVVVPLDPQLVFPAPIATRQKYIGRFHIRPNLYGAPDYPLSAISGTLVAIEDVDTAAFIGDVSGIAGTLVVTESADTAAFSGSITWTGTLVATEGADIASFPGSVTWTGALVATEGSDIASIQGSVTWTGTLIATEAADTAAMPGTVAWTTQLVATEGADVAAFTGFIVITGTLITTEGADAASFVGAGAACTGTLVATEAQDFIGSVGDTNFSSVVLLMGFEGANGSTGSPGMTDESSAAHGTANISGTGSISTAQSKFGGSALRVTGGVANGASYVDSADWQLAPTSTSPYTIEGFFRWNTTPVSTQALVAQWANGHPNNEAWFWVTGTTASEMRWASYADGTNIAVDITTSGAGLTSGVWYHLAVCFDGTKIRLFVDGVMKGSVTPGNAAIFNSSEGLTIGMDASGALPGFDGWVDELRITKGVARYASDAGFAVPTSAFPRNTGTGGWPGTVAWNTQLVATEGADTASFNALGSPIVSGPLITTEAADTASFTGRAAWQGPLIATEGADTAAMTGSVRWTGTLAATEGSDTANFQGTVAFAPATGTLVVIEAQDTASFSSIPAAAGTLVAIDRPDICKILGQPIQEPGDLNFGWPRVKVRRRL